MKKKTIKPIDLGKPDLSRADVNKLMLGLDAFCGPHAPKYIIKRLETRLLLKSGKESLDKKEEKDLVKAINTWTKILREDSRKSAVYQEIQRRLVVYDAVMASASLLVDNLMRKGGIDESFKC